MPRSAKFPPTPAAGFQAPVSKVPTFLTEPRPRACSE